MGCLVYKTEVNVINNNGDFFVCAQTQKKSISSQKVGKKSGKENIHTENGKYIYFNYLIVDKVTDASLMTDN